MKTLFKTNLLLLIALLLISGCSDDDSATPIQNDPTTFEIIAESPDHTTLEQLLTETGMQQVLNDGNFTIFAPTDAAFDQVDLSDVSDEELTNMLLNHVVNGTALSEDLSNTYLDTQATEGFTGNGDQLSLLINVDTDVLLNGAATVTTPDLEASNGVVHVTDAVIPMPDITTFATADPQFSTLAEALTRDDQPDFVQTLRTDADNAPAPFTLFAPTNQAFTDVLNELGLDALSDIDAATLTSTLNFHVLTESNVRSSDLMDGEVTTLEGENIDISASNAVITDLNGRVINITFTDVQTTNGVIHKVDKVILPSLPDVGGSDVVGITLDNSGASAYFVSEQTGGAVTSLNTDNSAWTFEVGQRYEISVVNSSAHPLMLRDASDNLLLGMQNADGNYSDDPAVNFVTDQSTGTFNFTVTQDLATQLDNYACQVHTNSMVGDINVN